MLEAILFDKAYFTKNEAFKWLNKNGYKPLKIHETDNFYRFRLIEPIRGARYRIKKIFPGIEFLFMF